MHTVNIDALEYIDTIEEQTITPLGEHVTASVACDCVRATITIAGVVGHWLYFKPEAIADRMHGYSLAEEEHAVEALVRERVFDWLPALEPADPTNHAECLGGVDDRIAVTWSDGAQAAAAELLKGEHAGRIAAYAEQIANREPPAQSVE